MTALKSSNKEGKSNFLTNKFLPFCQLLMPHTRYTLQINVLARQLLISKTGVLTRVRKDQHTEQTKT